MRAEETSSRAPPFLLSGGFPSSVSERLGSKCGGSVPAGFPSGPRASPRQ